MAKQIETASTLHMLACLMGSLSVAQPAAPRLIRATLLCRCSGTAAAHAADGQLLLCHCLHMLHIIQLLTKQPSGRARFCS